MRLRYQALAVILLSGSLLLAACGGDDNVQLGAPSSVASTTTTTLPPDASVSSPPLDPGASVPPSHPQLVVPTNDAVDVQPLSFDTKAVKAVTGGVLVRFWGGVAPCFVLDRFTVSETPETVTIGLFAGHAQRNDNVACIELALRYEVKVPLDAPLGNRRVTDANGR
jgi:hypothetical protein